MDGTEEGSRKTAVRERWNGTCSEVAAMGRIWYGTWKGCGWHSGGALEKDVDRILYVEMAQGGGWD